MDYFYREGGVFVYFQGRRLMNLIDIAFLIKTLLFIKQFIHELNYRVNEKEINSDIIDFYSIFIYF